MEMASRLEAKGRKASRTAAMVQQSTTTAARTGTGPGRKLRRRKSDNSLLMSQTSLKALKKRKNENEGREEREIRR
jgi:hypothetical protein